MRKSLLLALPLACLLAGCSFLDGLVGQSSTSGGPSSESSSSPFSSSEEATSSPGQFTSVPSGALRLEGNGDVLYIGEKSRIVVDYPGAEYPPFFKSSDPSVLSVDENGNVEAISPGIARVACSSADPYYCVNDAVIDIEVRGTRKSFAVSLFNKSQDLVEEGKDYSFFGDFIHAEKITEVVSLNPEVVEVNGLEGYRALSPGAAVLRAIDEDGNHDYLTIAVEGENAGEILFEETEGKKLVSGYRGEERNVYIPEGYDGIAPGAFEDSSLLSVAAPYIETIGESAFEDSSLVSFYWSGRLSDIGASAFEGTALTYLPLEESDSLRSIDDRAFADSKLEYAFVPYNDDDYDVDIGSDVFLDSPIEAVYFLGLESDYRIRVPFLEIPHAYGFGLLFRRYSDGTLLYADSFDSSRGNVLMGCNEYYRELDLSILKEGSEIATGAFYGNRRLRSLDMADRIAVVSPFALSGCTGLGEVDFSASLVSIGDVAFSSTGLSRVDLKEGLRTIGERAFEDSPALKEVHLPDGLASIGEGAFADCPLLEWLFVPKSAGILSDDFLGGSTSCRIVFGASTDPSSSPGNDSNPAATCGTGLYGEYDGFAFAIADRGEGEYATIVDYLGDEQEVAVPEEIFFSGKAYRVEELASYSFARTSVRKVSLPSGLKRVCDDAFVYCDELRYIVFPSSIEEIYGTFYRCDQAVLLFEGECPSLPDIFPNLPRLEHFAGDIFDYGDMVFATYLDGQGTKKASLLSLPDKEGRHELPQSVPFLEERLPLGSITDDGPFDYREREFELLFPYGLEEIGPNALCGNEKIVGASLPPTLLKIGECAFLGTSGLNEVHIPSSVLEVGRRAFTVQKEIHCEADSRPALWDEEWCDPSIAVYWGESLS